MAEVPLSKQKCIQDKVTKLLTAMGIKRQNEMVQCLWKLALRMFTTFMECIASITIKHYGTHVAFMVVKREIGEVNLRTNLYHY